MLRTAFCPVLMFLAFGLGAGCAQPPERVPPSKAAAPSAPASARPVRELQLVPVTSASPEALQAFLQARDASENSRSAEALQGFKRALELDSSFAFAHAFLGSVVAGASGRKELERARELSKGLPAAERLFIDYLYARGFGEQTEVDGILSQMVKLAPDDWRVHFEIGEQAFEQRDWSNAVVAFTRSLETAKNCEAYNNLGYSLAMMERWDPAIAALKRCTSLHPEEPNALDSLGEVYLAGNSLDEAEAVFARARQVDPRFWSAFHGGAVVLFMRGDWDGGLALLDKARPLSSLVSEQLEVDLIRAWSLFAKGDGPEALHTLDVLDKAAADAGGPGDYDAAEEELTRSFFLTEAKRYPEALAAAKLAATRALAPGLRGPVSVALQHRASLRETLALARSGQAAAARRGLHHLAEAASASKRGPELDTALHLAQGAVWEAEGKLDQARNEYAHCRPLSVSPWTYDYRSKPEDSFCAAQLVRMDEQLGEKGAASALRKSILRHVSRDPLDLYVRTLLHEA